MKSLVKTTGDFSLNDSAEKQYVDMNRPCVVANSFFIQRQISLGQIEVIATLPDEATDKEFAEYLSECEGDVELATESYRAALETPAPEGAEGGETPAPEGAEGGETPAPPTTKATKPKAPK